jgi:3-methylfumaryl-CoA hydratase
MTAATAAAPALTDWIGRTQERQDRIEVGAVRRLLATFDDAASQLGEGDPLPPMWHWLGFLPQTPQAEIGPDGHPASDAGELRPAMGLPRRMYAGGSYLCHTPLPIGRPLRRLSTLTDIVEKTGKSGRLVFLTLRHQFFSSDTLCVEEVQNAVYREAGPKTPAPVAINPLPPLPANAWVRTIAPDPVLLFRYSALTFNAHRIHYDRPYATQVEGYPGLIVHGPLIAMLLLELVRRHSSRPVRRFQFRAQAPLFDTAPFRIIGIPTADGAVALHAERVDGAVAMAAEAKLG